MRIFLDANILFSAAKSNGAIRHLLNELRQAGHECWTDEYVIGEARRNLTIKCPAAAGEFEHLLSTIQIVPQMPIPSPHELPPELPNKDRPVLAAAIHHQCEALVTGDSKHFGPLYGQTIAGVTVHSPRSIAEILFP